MRSSKQDAKVKIQNLARFENSSDSDESTSNSINSIQNSDFSSQDLEISLADQIPSDSDLDSVINMTEIKVTDLLKDIKDFSGNLNDINKFLSSCRAAYDFIGETEEHKLHRERFLNGIKNKLDSATFNAISQQTFNSIVEFSSAIEGIFLISNDPSNVQMQIVNRKQKHDENIMTYANKLLELHNEYLMLYKLKYPTADQESVKISNDMLLTQNFIRNLKQPFQTYSRGHFFDSFSAAKKWALDLEKTEKPQDDSNIKDLISALNKLGVKANYPPQKKQQSNFPFQPRNKQNNNWRPNFNNASTSQSHYGNQNPQRLQNPNPQQQLQNQQFNGQAPRPNAPRFNFMNQKKKKNQQQFFPMQHNQQQFYQMQQPQQQFFPMQQFLTAVDGAQQANQKNAVTNQSSSDIFYPKN